MFGYIEANVRALSPAQLQRYRGAYCGLCRTLKARYGQLSRMTLNYDMTFLVLLLSSMYEPEEHGGADRCLIHPVRRRSWWANRFTDYAADMNVALAYFNCLDDWQDEKKPLALAEAKLLKAAYQKAAERWPRQCAAIETCTAALRAIETSADPAPDAAADCFGQLMGTLFTPVEDPVWGPHFQAFGEALGRFIYMMDACVDYDRDRKRGGYNPLCALRDGELSQQEKLALLKMHIGECTAEFERLPLVQDVEILRSVLYSGVWIKYAGKMKKEMRDAEDDQRSV